MRQTIGPLIFSWFTFTLLSSIASSALLLNCSRLGFYVQFVCFIIVMWFASIDWNMQNWTTANSQVTVLSYRSANILIFHVLRTRINGSTGTGILNTRTGSIILEFFVFATIPLLVYGKIPSIMWTARLRETMYWNPILVQLCLYSWVLFSEKRKKKTKFFVSFRFSFSTCMQCANVRCALPCHAECSNVCTVYAALHTPCYIGIPISWCTSSHSNRLRPNSNSDYIIWTKAVPIEKSIG